MEQIQLITVQGLKLHVANIGTGPNVIVFLHGFPEIWYSWWHQMIGLAHSGFRANALDYHGYGLSDPPQPDKASYRYLISDLLGILDSLAFPKSEGALELGQRTYLPFAYPERVLGVITIGVPIIPPGPLKFDKNLPEGFYISRWQEPGWAEADFGRFDAKTVVQNIYILFSRSDIPITAENQEIINLVDPSTPLPPMNEDLAAYGALYEKSSFQTALQIPYRALRQESGLTNLIVKAPALCIMGGKDYVNKFPGIDYYIDIGRVKEFIPNLEIQFMSKGWHFVQEQSPDEVNQLSITFLGKHV